MLWMLADAVRRWRGNEGPRPDRFLPEVRRALRWAGWWEGRVEFRRKCVRLDHLPARVADIIHEFGGLNICPARRLGTDLAPSSVGVSRHAKPLSTEWFNPASSVIEMKVVYLIGSLDGGHAELAADETGAIFLQFEDATWQATDMDAALKMYLTGTNPDRSESTDSS